MKFSFKKTVLTGALAIIFSLGATPSFSAVHHDSLMNIMAICQLISPIMPIPPLGIGPIWPGPLVGPCLPSIMDIPPYIW